MPATDRVKSKEHFGHMSGLGALMVLSMELMKFQWNFIAFEMDNEISLIMRDQCFFDVSYFELLQCLWTTNCVYFWSYLTILTFTIFWPRGSAVSSHHSSIFLKQCKIQIITIVLLAVYIKHFDEISLKFQWNFIETCEISSLELRWMKF